MEEDVNQNCGPLADIKVDKGFNPFELETFFAASDCAAMQENFVLASSHFAVTAQAGVNPKGPNAETKSKGGSE